jgi:phytoene synthase
MTDRDAFAYCAAEVRRYDYDRYLAALFAPPEARSALIALYAFNLEVAKVREVVSEPLIGRMRLQWWREHMDDILAGRPPQHGVATALAASLVRERVSRRHFDRLIDARETDLEDAPPADLAALEAYVEGTSSALVGGALEVLGAFDADVARSAGLAWGLTGLLRALPHHIGTRRLNLPADRLRAAGADAEDVFARRRPEAVAAVIAEVADAAERHLRDARARAGTVMAAGRAALVPLALVGGHLARLRRRSGDPYAGDLEIARLVRQTRIGWAALTRRF